MAKISETPFAEAVRAIGLSQVEIGEILVGHGYSPSSAVSMSNGKTGTPREVLDILAGLWAQVDGKAPLMADAPASMVRRRETIKMLRDRKNCEEPRGPHYDLVEPMPKMEWTEEDKAAFPVKPLGDLTDEDFKS